MAPKNGNSRICYLYLAGRFISFVKALVILFVPGLVARAVLKPVHHCRASSYDSLLFPMNGI